MEIKPCPFCRGVGVIRPTYDERLDRAKASYNVACLKCRTTGPLAVSEQLAVAKWNTRPGMASSLSKEND